MQSFFPQYAIAIVFEITLIILLIIFGRAYIRKKRKEREYEKKKNAIIDDMYDKLNKPN